MSKRKITQQQSRRIAQIQAQRRQRAKKKLRISDEELATQQLGPEQNGLLIARFYAHVDIEDDQGKIIQCHLRQHLADPVTGDHVIWRAGPNDTGVVVAIEPRQSELVRADRETQLKPIAANISQMFIVLAVEPEPSLLQLDKFLTGAQLLQIKPIILINKSDQSTSKALYQQVSNIYTPLGYSVILASAKQQTGLTALLTQLKDQTSIFVGQSGVGKSSLLKATLPEQSIAVGELSEQSGLGTHTTTTSRLYHCPEGGDVIDSPGVRQFSLWPITLQELLSGYQEFTPYLEHCHFRNCHHDHETQCAIKQAVEDGKISEIRYQNYLTLLHTVLEP